MCFCCVGSTRNTIIVLKASVLITIYSLLREVVKLCLNDRRTFDWKTGLFLCCPIIDMVLIVLGIRGIKLKKQKFLMPVLSCKVIYFIETCTILAIIPVACYNYGFERAIEEFRYHFLAMGMNENTDAESMPFYWKLMLMIFKSLLIFPMEEIVHSRNYTVAIVYIVYLVIVAVFQGYCVITLKYSYNSMKVELPPRYSIARRQMDESTTYLLVPEGTTPENHPVSSIPYPVVDEKLYRKIESTSETIPICIN